MEALKFDLEIPFWCSFGDFSSLNIKLSYPFPPLPTLFGLIQNSLGKPALHLIKDKKVMKKLMNQYIEDFNHLKFSIIINNSGELIEDYVNIHKGSREQEKFEDNLKKLLDEFIKNKEYQKEIKKDISILKKFEFYKFLILETLSNDEFEMVFNRVKNIDSLIIDKIYDYWNYNTSGFKNYEINKIWLSTQINRQRLITPSFSIIITSDVKEGEFSLKNIKKCLTNPKRPLYLGESDDIVNILNISLIDINKSSSSEISSVLPDLYSNSELIKIPCNLKYDKEKEFLKLCSIPNGKLDKSVDCFSYNGENFVFL